MKSARTNTHEAISERDSAVVHVSPVHLRAVAHLCGHQAPPLDKARVLELGCGRGRNLQAFALAYPEAQVVGIDLWPDELAAGENEALALGIKNLQFLPMLYLDVDDTLGVFDYIIVRDEYSWAPDAMREALLRIAAQNLAPGGLVHVGFHTYPGGHTLDVVRDAIQLHAHDAASMEDVRSAAGAMLQLMSSQNTSDPAHAQDVKRVAQRLSSHPEYFINTDFLQRPHNATYLIDLVSKAQEQGLVYLSDALPLTEQAKSYGHPTQLQMGLVAMGKVWPVRQQYLDFALNRTFRRSLFTRQPSVEPSHVGADLSRFQSLRFACALKRRFSPAQAARSATTSYVLPDGQQHDYKDARTVAALDILGCAWPHTLSFQHIAAATRYIEPALDEAAQASAVQAVLEQLMAEGVLRVASGPGPYDDDQSSGIQLIGSLAAVGAQPERAKKHLLFNLWGESQKISIGGSLQGVVELFEQLAQGDASALAARPETFKIVEYLRWNGLLKGTDEAWLQYYAAVLTQDGIDLGEKMLLLPAYVAHAVRRDEATAKQAKNPGKQDAGRPPMQMLRELEKFWEQRAFGKLGPAAETCARRFPKDPAGWHLLALMQNELGQSEAAMRNFLKAIALKPNDPNPYIGLIMGQAHVRGSAISRIIFGLVTWLRPNYVAAYINLGNYYHGNERMDEAERCVDYVLSLEPDNIVALKNKSVYLSERGNTEQALSLLEKIVHKNPSDLSMGSNYLYNLSLSESVTPQALFEAHRRYGAEVARYAGKSGLKFKHLQSRDPERPLRVGFVSGDLRNHAVSRFIQPVWQKMDRSNFQIFAYNVCQETDEVTASLMSLAHKWTPAASLSYENLARQIHEDGIDVLFDLSGHTGHNRLPTFGLKPAPIQMTWIGYPGTTGLQAMDYYIFNQYLAPEGFLDWQFTEKPLRMPATATFDPAVEAPDVNELPASKNGFFTFGSFNRMNKVNPLVIEAWAKILHRVPKSRLVVGHADAVQEATMRALLKEQGISPERLSFHPRQTLKNYMGLHHSVDMLLDTFPYNGGTTTCYGLWMGVPTLTLAGETVPARTGAAVMGLMGMPDFIANDVAEYIEKAVQLSADQERLQVIRRSARNRFLSEGSYWHSEAVAQSLQLAVRQAWRLWCAGQPAQTFTVQ